MVGSPRWYHAKFQDEMATAIVSGYHYTNFFITVTCNPIWSEIWDRLKKCQTPHDRTVLVPRVFKQKNDQVMQDLKSDFIMGKVVAHMNAIEFQRRGLAHTHIFIILADDEQFMTQEFVDSIVLYCIWSLRYICHCGVLYIPKSCQISLQVCYKRSGQGNGYNSSGL